MILSLTRKIKRAIQLKTTIEIRKKEGEIKENKDKRVNLKPMRQLQKLNNKLKKSWLRFRIKLRSIKYSSRFL